MAQSKPQKKSIHKNKKIIFGIALGAIVISVITAIFVVVLGLQKTESKLAYHWNYAMQEKWGGLCDTGIMQSPIPLEEELCNKTALPSLSFENVDYYEKVEVKNDGHTVTVKLDVCNCSKPRLSGGGLAGNYTFDNVHFHWPSEHVINGEQYELEAHFVFFSEQYENLSTALNFPNAVTVVGILFEEVRTRTHNNFRVIDDAVEEISSKAGTSFVTSNGITIYDFFPGNNSEFFKYIGSLTSPSCKENVNWIVFKDTSLISKTDLKRLIHIYNDKNELLESNNRRLQNVNKREVYLQQMFE